jgi:hypothetical protein
MESGRTPPHPHPFRCYITLFARSPICDALDLTEDKCLARCVDFPPRGQTTPWRLVRLFRPENCALLFLCEALERFIHLQYAPVV